MGGKGEQATDKLSGNAGYNQLYNQPKYLSDPRMQDILTGYGQGKTSLADALAAARGQDPAAAEKAAGDAYNKMWSDMRSGKFNQGINGGGGGKIDEAAWSKAQENYNHLQDAAWKAKDDAAGGMDRINAIFTNPLTGTQAATDQVMNNELFKPYIDYGKGLIGEHGKVGGFLDEDRNALLGRDESYGLQDSDLKALGQASDNTARQYAASDQSLAQMLADRGLSQAPSGAAMQAFSTQLGNKNEQLSQMQHQIAKTRIDTARGLAQDRMQADLQRRGQLQGGIQGMADLSNRAVNDQYSRNLGGAQHYQGQLKDSLNAGLAGQDMQNNAFSQIQSTKGPSFGDILAGAGTGLLGAATGGFGTAMGAGLGKGLFGGGGGNQKNLLMDNSPDAGTVGPPNPYRRR